MSMLHFEMFAGTELGALSTDTLPFRRRGDLIDPTPYLDAALLLKGATQGEIRGDADPTRFANVA
ncbi:hypothetical protein [Novosphingobium sp. BL-52-GroH]|uniref:hypothetical protein n=1 Tax=Novosphingobium sp. BL-52-GroH TaxID=3349877 RepID=UPI00384DCB84